LVLTPGTHLGIYEITAAIGEGGMGQVYRAIDAKLKRQVAIKVLPPSLAVDAGRLARFQREGEVLASLNHPNIAYAAGRTARSSQLYLRALGDFAARAVAGSPGAQYPFFSPDGRAIAFFADGKPRRASVVGGGAIDIASARRPCGGARDADGRAVFTTELASGLWRVPADGGTPEQLTKPDGAGAGYVGQGLGLNLCCPTTGTDGCGMASQTRRGITKAAPDAERTASGLTPANDTSHAAHRERLGLHHGRVRSHLVHRCNRTSDK
jgi:hypothetical protein